MRISCTKGSAIYVSLAWRREYPEERDYEVNAEVRLEVVVRLTPARRAGGYRRQGIGDGVFDVPVDGRRRGHQIVLRVRLASGARRSKVGMRVRRHLRNGQRYFFCAARLGQDEAVTLMHREPASQVGQSERRLPVAPVSRAYELEQGLVLGYRQQLAFAKHPPRRGKVAREHSYFTYIWLCHVYLLSWARGISLAARW